MQMTDVPAPNTAEALRIEKATYDLIGRVHASIMETGKRINTAMLAQTLLSLLVLALAYGVIGSGSDYLVAGLKLQVAAPLIIVSAATAAAGLLMYHLALVSHEADLVTLAVTLYEDV